MMLNIENIPAWTVTIFAQTSVLILLGMLCSRLFRWNAAARHTVLLTTLLAACLLPAASFFFRSNQLSIWPTIQAWMSEPNTMKSPQEQLPVLIEYSDSVETEWLPLRSDTASRFDSVSRSVIATTWSIVTILLAARLCIALAGLERIRRRATHCATPKIQALVRNLCKQMGIRSDTELWVSRHVRAPVAIGIFRPAILVPELLLAQLSEQELRNVLIHELAHIQRRDHVVLMLQKLIAMLFWPQPLLHLLNRMLSRSREEICDNHVLRFSERVSYGETLLKLTEHVNPAFSLGLLGNAWKLEDRISQLLSERRNPVTSSNLFVRSAALVALGLATAVISLATPLDAQESKEETITAELTTADGSRIIELKSPDGKSVLARSTTNTIVDAENGTFDDSELSPGDKQVAEKLKSKYESLQEEQNNIATKLKELESKLNQLGVKLGKSRKSATLVGANAPNPHKLSDRKITYSFANGAAISSVTSGSQAPEKVATVEEITIRLDPKLATPRKPVPTPSRVAEPNSPENLEERLQRLELLIEKVIEVNEKSHSDASASESGFPAPRPRR